MPSLKFERLKNLALLNFSIVLTNAVNGVRTSSFERRRSNAVDGVSKYAILKSSNARFLRPFSTFACY